MYKIYNEDCIIGSKKHFDSETVDLVICDPPFGINETSFGKHYNRDEGVVINGYVEAPVDYYKFTYEWLEEAKRLLKSNGSMYIVSGWSNLKDILNVVDSLGLIVINHIVWKFNFGVHTKKKFVSSHYHIIYIKKSSKSKPVFNTHCRFAPHDKDYGGNSLQYQDLQDVWIINKDFERGEKKNKNKLPEELVNKMVLYSSNTGEVVCDFFMGNFTTAVCSIKLDREPVGFELNKETYSYYMKKIEEIIPGSSIPPIKFDFNLPENQGKRVSDEERHQVIQEYSNIKTANFGLSKAKIINKLCKIYGRGRFSILNILKQENI